MRLLPLLVLLVAGCHGGGSCPDGTDSVVGQDLYGRKVEACVSPSMHRKLGPFKIYDREGKLDVVGRCSMEGVAVVEHAWQDDMDTGQRREMKTRLMQARAPDGICN
jgi:hypothetical protein